MKALELISYHTNSTRNCAPDITTLTLPLFFDRPLRSLHYQPYGPSFYTIPNHVIGRTMNQYRRAACI